jgi:NADPH2:quinone reductase
VEVNLAANLQMDLGLAGPDTVIVVYAADLEDPVLPVRACMSANLRMRFVLLYGVARPDLETAAAMVHRALVENALTELPLVRFPLDRCADAQEAVRSGVTGKVVLEIP